VAGPGTAGASSAVGEVPPGAARRAALNPDRPDRENARVPRISAFYGIVIWMYHDEIHHLGRPHFHARYGGDEASLTIETVEVLAGELPPRALRLVRDWASSHQEELRENWNRARRHEPLRRIEPLR